MASTSKTILQLFWMTIVSTIISYLLVIAFRAVGLENVIKFFRPVEINIPYPLNIIIGAGIVILGFIAIIWANYILLVKKKISLENREPFHIPEALATGGIYKYSRNPIYLGSILLIFGTGIVFLSLTAIIFSIIIWMVFNFWFIKWEEEKLSVEFGEEYMNFKQQTRRWF